MTTQTLAPEVKFDSEGNSTSASVKVRLDHDEFTATKTLDVFASASEDSDQIYLNIRQHTYSSVFPSEALTSFGDILSGHHFTRAEAEIIVKALSAELAK